MRYDRGEFELYGEVSKETGVPVRDIAVMVNSFFSVILNESRSLPFDDIRKIFRRDRFDELSTVRNIPYIGRIGPSYTRYLKWRQSEARNIEQRTKEDYKTKLSPEEIDDMAQTILAGGRVEITRKKKKELYNNVWLVGTEGKRAARQVIPKQTD